MIHLNLDDLSPTKSSFTPDSLSQLLPCPQCALSQGVPQSDALLKFALGDKVDRNPIVVDVDAIASTAFVLPCVESPTDQFPVDIEKATYFLVMPPRGDWKNIGWDAA
jgi:hypothetical protein